MFVHHGNGLFVWSRDALPITVTELNCTPRHTWFAERAVRARWSASSWLAPEVPFCISAFRDRAIQTNAPAVQHGSVTRGAITETPTAVQCQAMLSRLHYAFCSRVVCCAVKVLKLNADSDPLRPQKESADVDKGWDSMWPRWVAAVGHACDEGSLQEHRHRQQQQQGPLEVNAARCDEAMED